MKIISDMIENMDEEIESAKKYAEDYLDAKVKGDNQLAMKYKEFANDELKHANHIHEQLVNKITELQRFYTPPVEMEERWNKEHKCYLEQAVFIKSMLAM